MQTPHTPLSRTEGPECSLALGQVAAVLRGMLCEGLNLSLGWWPWGSWCACPTDHSSHLPGKVSALPTCPCWLWDLFTCTMDMSGPEPWEHPAVTSSGQARCSWPCGKTPLVPTDLKQSEHRMTPTPGTGAHPSTSRPTATPAVCSQPAPCALHHSPAVLYLLQLQRLQSELTQIMTAKPQAPQVSFDSTFPCPCLRMVRYVPSVLPPADTRPQGPLTCEPRGSLAAIKLVVPRGSAHLLAGWRSCG